MNIRHGVTSIFAICLSAIFTLSAFAQSQTTGRITGTVKDEKGAVIRGAEVTIANKATAEARTAVADEEGNYIVSFVPPGVYQVSVKADGFKKAVFDNIRVVITETTSVNAELSVGAAEESITITSAPPLAQTDGAQLGRLVDSRAVAELPLATRNFTQILGLSPGAATYLPDNTSVGRNSQNLRKIDRKSTRLNSSHLGI